MQIQGARYESSACSVVLSAGTEDKAKKTAGTDGRTYMSRKGARYESHPCSMVLSAGTDNKPLEVAVIDGQADQGQQPQQWICLLDKTVEAAGVDSQTDRSGLAAATIKELYGSTGAGVHLLQRHMATFVSVEQLNGKMLECWFTSDAKHSPSKTHNHNF